MAAYFNGDSRQNLTADSSERALFFNQAPRAATQTTLVSEGARFEKIMFSY